MGVSIKPVNTRSGIRRFVDFPHRLYDSHPYWVPPLRRSEIQTFLHDANPAFDHCDVQLWIVTKDGQMVGRIAGIVNQLENQHKTQQWARFGWYDFEEDGSISTMLMDQVIKWARSKGCTKIKGPYGFSNMDKAGMLTFGFNELPTMAESYNHPYYPEQMETMGFEKLVDYKSFEATVPEALSDRVIKFADLVAARYGLYTVPFRSRRDVGRVGHEVFSLLNVAYADLESYVPHTQRQISLIVSQYQSLVNPDFLSVIRDGSDRIVAFGITMPSISKALQGCRGRLFPFGFFQLRSAMYRNDRADLIFIGVHPDYKNKGLTAIIFKHIINTYIRYGIKKAETNPEMESNQQVQNLWKDYEMRQHKRRRCYQQQI
ncbi:MAG: GNAT family N-acetyltransferase [Saprospiraceae bacterium]|nr:GNAT family N-acetyltransferase [Saprospiraceae bacterium]